MGGSGEELPDVDGVGRDDGVGPQGRGRGASTVSRAACGAQSVPLRPFPRGEIMSEKRQAWIDPSLLRGAGEHTGPDVGFVSTLTEDVGEFALRRWDGTPPLQSGSPVEVIETRSYGLVLVQEFDVAEMELLEAAVEVLRGRGLAGTFADRFPKGGEKGVTWS